MHDLKCKHGKNNRTTELTKQLFIREWVYVCVCVFAGRQVESATKRKQSLCKIYTKYALSGCMVDFPRPLHVSHMYLSLPVVVVVQYTYLHSDLACNRAAFVLPSIPAAYFKTKYHVLCAYITACTPNPPLDRYRIVFPQAISHRIQWFGYSFHLFLAVFVKVSYKRTWLFWHDFFLLSHQLCKILGRILDRKSLNILKGTLQNFGEIPLKISIRAL